MTAQPLSDAEYNAAIDLADKVLVKNDGRHGDPLHSPYQWNAAYKLARAFLATISRDRQKARVGEDVVEGLGKLMDEWLDDKSHSNCTPADFATAILAHLHSIGYVMRPEREATIKRSARAYQNLGTSEKAQGSAAFIADALLSAMEGEKGV